MADYEQKALKTRGAVRRFAAGVPVFVTAYTPNDPVHVKVGAAGIDEMLSATDAGQGEYVLLGTRFAHGLFLNILETWEAEMALAERVVDRTTR